MGFNFVSSKDSSETRIIHSRSDNMEIMVGNEADEIVLELFDSLLKKHQHDLEESMKSSKFAFDEIDLLCHKRLNLK